VRATDDDRLLAINAKGARLWEVKQTFGPLAGAPLRLGGDLLLATRGGILLRLDAASGKESAKADAGCPLGTGPVASGPKLLVGGYDGTLHEVRLP